MWQDEREPVMISALEHYSYCPRQCALIHLEQTFEENLYTLRGSLAHKRVDTPIERFEHQMRVERGLPLWSSKLGLIGKADVVEFHDTTPFPVEYKLGKRRNWAYEAIQVCAQALCLEEMFGLEVPAGAIYYCSSRVRRDILFDQTLRSAVANATEGVRALLHEKQLPSAVSDQRCQNCSLRDACLPEVVMQSSRIQQYQSTLFHLEEKEDW